MKLTVQELTSQAFAPFGKVIEQPSREQDASGPGWSWWSETALLPADTRPYEIGYLDLRPASWQFDWAERHMRSMELLIPSGGDCLVYVGPPDYQDEPDHIPSLDCFQVFRVREGQAALLDKGVWHGAPLAVDRPLKVVVLLLQNSGKQDLHLVRFEDTPVTIE